jgi:acyl-CoA dehydrogenase
MFLPKNHFANEGSPGFTNLEYGLMAEQLGKSRIASEACNCAAPDTGNMEVIARYGNKKQKDTWLRDLLDGKIRSGFLMTEPDVASSDGSNIQLRMEKKGDHFLLNGSKWWSSGAGDDRCKIFIVMGKTDPTNPDRFKQQSMMLVPSDTPGITVHRMLSVYGYDDAPHGHGHVTFKDVRVPLDALILGEGRGNEIMQGRLGPGRIHHCMRAIGAAEVALEWMIHRMHDERKVPFGKPLREHGVLIDWVAKARMDIDACRLVVLNASIKIDQRDAKFALKEIAEVCINSLTQHTQPQLQLVWKGIFQTDPPRPSLYPKEFLTPTDSFFLQAKVMVPNMALDVIDKAVQVHGAMGVCQDTPLANMWAHLRTLRIADGPDEVSLHESPSHFPYSHPPHHIHRASSNICIFV